MKISISPLTPNRTEMSLKEAWAGTDQGLIGAWEAGRHMAEKDAAKRRCLYSRELPSLPYSGGYEKATKQGTAFAPFHYLAMWHGLREEDC